MLSVPYYESKGDPNRCFEASMKSVLKYFTPNSDCSLEQLDEMVGRKPGMWTYTHQIVPVLHKLGLNVRFYSRDTIERYTTKRRLLGLLKNSYDKKSLSFVLQHTDVETVVAKAVECQRYTLFEAKRLRFNEIERHIDMGHIPMVLLDWHTLESIRGPYQGHFVVMTGYDSDNVYYHENSESMPVPNRKVPKVRFAKAWDNVRTGNDVVIALGTR